MATRFIDIILKHFPEFSLNDIKLAFELAETGGLDEYLPKNKDGQPDREHYQSFNMKYWTKIFRAYKANRSSLISSLEAKVQRIEAAKPLEISKEEQLYNHDECVKELCGAFYNYKYKSVEPKFHLSLFIKEVINQGFIDKLPEPTKKQLDQAFSRLILSKSISRTEKSAIKEQKRRGIWNEQVKTNARLIAYDQRLKKWFDKLITEDKDPAKLLK